MCTPRQVLWSQSWMRPSQLKRLGCARGLTGNGLLVLGRTLEQKLIRMKCAVGAHLSGHYGLGLILEQVGFGARILHRDPIAG